MGKSTNQGNQIRVTVSGEQGEKKLHSLKTLTCTSFNQETPCSLSIAMSEANRSITMSRGFESFA